MEIIHTPKAFLQFQIKLLHIQKDGLQFLLDFMVHIRKEMPQQQVEIHHILKGIKQHQMVFIVMQKEIQQHLLDKIRTLEEFNQLHLGTLPLFTVQDQHVTIIIQRL